MSSLGDLLDDSGGDKPKYESIHIFNIEYTDYNGNLSVHLFGRLQNGEFRHVKVTGHNPSFFIKKSDYNKQVKNHHAVVRAERGYQSIHGDALIRLYTSLPKDIGGGRDSNGLRDYFEQTWEADVFYADRFLIDTGIKTHVRVDRSEAYEADSMNADYAVGVDDLQPIRDPNWRVEPKTITVDIEVYSEGGFPEAADAEWPVTAIVTHNNYTNSCRMWLLADDEYHDTDIESDVREAVYQNRPAAVAIEDGTDVTNALADVSVFYDESLLLDDFNTYINGERPDVLAGWNSSGTDNGDAFDYPYLLNRSKKLNTYSTDGWSPLGQVWTTRRGREQNLTMGAKGVTFLDGMTTYQKTLWSEPDGGLGLDNISAIELDGDAAKLDLSDEVPDGYSGAEAINWAWKHDWGLFGKYVLRDVQATVGIDRASGATNLYQNLRRLTGAQLESCHNNIDLLDHYILRFAQNEGIVLPTNTEPDRNWFYGGHVFSPIYGRHNNTIYPDVWSEYPNAFRTCNLSPETLIGTEEDLRESEYDESDCRWSYIDTRRDAIKEETDPEYEKCYYLKPSVKKGFMNKVVDHVMGLKDDYDGTELYGPVKQVVNSVWGVYGDADSYGKGYRLFDWRVAESITLYGRTVIQNTAEKFIEEMNEIKDERGLDGKNAYVVGGDTDSVMTSLPFLDNTVREQQETAIEVAELACDRVNDWYVQLAEDQFNVDPDATEHGRTLNGSEVAHYIELEIESYGPTLYIPEAKTAAAEGKKRYAQLISWDEGDWEYDGAAVVDNELQGEVSYTGIDVVRSDRADVTKDLMKRVLQHILRAPTQSDAREKVYNEIESTITAIRNGETDNEYIARPRGMSMPPEQYGSPTNTPMPCYRGAKYANQNFDWENMTGGSKPELLYIDKIRGEHPRTYSAETKEDGRVVDAIALEHPNRLPKGIVVDTDKMIEKVIEDPLDPILAPLNWSVEEALSDTEQVGFEDFM